MSDSSEYASAVPAARPAATVIVARDGERGLEVLLLKRSDVGAFAGMWVFPGGRVDPGDAGEDELSRAATAAAREAMEEVSLDLDPSTFVPVSHWTPPATAPKRYATWFFVAPWNGAEVTIDDHEIVASRWITPAEVFAEGLPMAPPTWVTVSALAEAGSLAGVHALIAERGVDRFVTRPVHHLEELVLLWHGDAGYESGDPTLVGERHRITLARDRPPRYERSRFGTDASEGSAIFPASLPPGSLQHPPD